MRGSLGVNLMSESFAELFEESFASKQIKPGSIITGTVVAVNDDVVLVTAGLKSEAVISIEQFYDDQGETDIAVGDEIEVALDAVENGFGETVLSNVPVTLKIPVNFFKALMSAISQFSKVRFFTTTLMSS